MKRFILILLLSVFLLSGCSSQSTDSGSTPAPSESPQPSSEVLSSYEDEIVSCQYNPSLLQAKYFGKLSSFSYLWVASPIGYDMATAITDGDCIYVCTLDSDSDYGDTYEILPVEMTEAFFDGLFQKEADVTASINKSGDDLYEYVLSQSGYTFKGKIFSVKGGSVSAIVYRVNDDSSAELSNAFEECYNSMLLTPPVSAQSSSLEDHLAQPEKETAEDAQQTVKITEGELYDSITGIHPDVTIRQSSGSLSIRIKLSHESSEKDSIKFYDLISSICQSCELEKYCSTVSFSLEIDDEFITMFSLIDYTSPTSFSSTEPFSILVDEYKEPVSDLYWIYFSSNDVGNSFDREIDKLKEKYGIEK